MKIRFKLIKILDISSTYALLDQSVKTGQFLHASSLSKKFLVIISLNLLLIRFQKFGKNHYPTNLFFSFCLLVLTQQITLTILPRKRNNSPLIKFQWVKNKKNLLKFKLLTQVSVMESG